MTARNYVELVGRVERVNSHHFSKKTRFYYLRVSIGLPEYRRPRGNTVPQNPRVMVTLVTYNDVIVDKGDIISVVGHIEEYKRDVVVRAHKYGIRKQIAPKEVE